MAVTVLPVSSATESVKQAVRSTATCSDATVLSLQTMLRAPSKASEKPARKTTKLSKDTSVPPSRPKSSRTATTRTNDTALHDHDVPALAPQEKLVLATEVFNATLKTLTDASKVPVTKRQQFLNENGTLRETKSTRDTNVAELDKGTYSVAECARISLATLRALKNERGKEESLNMQLEQGVCVLVGKLISLGLGEMACKELRALKKRIEQHLDMERTGKNLADARKIWNEETGRERMSDLITFSNIANAQSLHSLLVSYQANAMRLIAFERKASTVQKLCPLLQLSEASSPAQIIIAALKSGALAKDKAALQLQLLSNTVLSLCTAKTLLVDNPSDSNDILKPITILSLQLLSLEIRCLGWKIAGHVCDESKEMLDPILRYLGGFSHQSQVLEKAEFATVYKTITRIQTTMEDVQRKKQEQRDTTAAPKVMTILGQLALDAGCLDESLKLFSEAVPSLSTSQSVSLATVRCKIASVHFQALRSLKKPYNKALDSMSKATSALGLQLRGSAIDLDELLVEAARLKKLALSWFGDAITADAESDTDRDEIAVQIREYLQAFLRFLRRYIGRAPSENSDDKELEMFNTRVSISKNIIIAAVDSAVAVGKLSIKSRRPPWDDMLPVLIDCQRLLATVEGATQCSLDDSLCESVNMSLVKLSNLFWSRYIKEREAGQGNRELLTLLKHSTHLLPSCSSSHRTIAFAALKFEKIAHLYLDARVYDESEKSFRQSIAEYVSAGNILQLIESRPGVQPGSKSKDHQSPAFMLGRVLSALLKVNLRQKRSKSSTIYDDANLDAEQRGFLLEWQISLLADLHGYCATENDFCSTLSPLVFNLLDIYNADSFPLRRKRMILSVLQILLEHPSALDQTLSENLLSEATSSLHCDPSLERDAHLAAYAIHITNSLRIMVGFHKGLLDADVLDDTLASWDSMIRQCSDWDSLLLRVNDTDFWSLQLKALVDYTEIHGNWKAQLSILDLILRVTELQQSEDLSDAIMILSRLVLQHCRIGHCHKAGNLLARGERYLGRYKVSPLASLSYRLARVEYLLETGKVDIAKTVFSTAKALYEKTQGSGEMGNLSVSSKISWERLVADAALLQSRLSTAGGSITHALYFAKLSVRLNCRIWAKIERLAQRKQEKTLTASASSDVDAVADGVAKLDLSQNGSSPDVSISYTQGAPFWPHLGSHHTCLLNLAMLSAHHGLFQDAIYYGEQALKIDKILNANARLVAAQTQLGCYWILGGHCDEGQALLTAASASSKQMQTSIESVSLHIALASLYKLQDQHDKALRSLQEADRLVTAVISSDDSNLPKAPIVANLEEDMERLQLRSARRTPSTTTATTSSRRTRATTSSKVSGAANILTPKPCLSDVHSKSLLRLKGDVLRQQADCLRSLRDFERSARMLSEARQFSCARESKLSLEIGESEHLLADAIRHFASHAVYCVLPESTISLPSLKSPMKIVDDSSSQVTKPSTVKRSRAPARGSRSKAQKASEDFSVMLSKASNCLTGVFTDATVLGSTVESHAASRLMSRISMLSHATTPGGPATWAQSPANMNEIGRVSAFSRERLAIEFDRQLANFGDSLLWPSSLPSNVGIDEEMCTNFTENYVDILPGNWNVLSLSLSADMTEFVVSRLQKDRSPFLLRLPLRRGNSDDDDDEQFTYEDGKEEMQELIKLANQSAHAAKAQTDKASKKEWWKTREALDRRMENLLQNIENVWFGGFRGVFSPLTRDSHALARFASAFQCILDKHLPSRQKGGKATSPRLTLHQNVVELFTGIRELEKQEEPEDTLMDLLYFVVDILQFQGERNAYDEIDFDMMVVDTLDALRIYHETAQEDIVSRPPNHTILVLDKALHLFPWESLPCLQGFPVCRVPSLACLRDRVLQFRSSQSGAVVDRTSGTYILNPTGDLRTTQATFEEDLTGLKTWKGVVNREPTEDEFRASLETKDLFLYFGHGSGAQYIRGRTVKRMTKCGVAFLMGCSSGTLTGAGDYEPYGTPMNYLQAGSPALVATLWDVTDKDIDRFATSTFDTWGLLGKKNKSGTQASDAGLDAAVAGARSSCVLKYLNGAAPVIYGVPVFLD